MTHCALALNGRNRSFLNNVPRLNFQEEVDVSNQDGSITTSRPKGTSGISTSRPKVKTTRRPALTFPSNDTSSSKEQAKIDYEILQNRLAKFPHSKFQAAQQSSNVKINGKNNETIVKHIEPSEGIDEGRLVQVKSDLYEYESRLKSLNPGSESSSENRGRKSSSSGNSTLVSLLEDLLNKGNPRQGPNRKQVTVIPLPTDSKPSWFVTPPPLPEEALSLLNNGQTSDSNVSDENDKPLTTDFIPAGKQLPLFAPPAQSSDSDITKMAYKQAGDSRFNWLVSYQNSDKGSRKSSNPFDSEFQ